MIVLGGSQFTRCIPSSKREAKIKNQAGFVVFDKFSLLVNLGDESGGSLLNILFLITSQVNSTLRAFFYHTELGQNLFFFVPFKPIILQFSQFCKRICTHSINDDQSTRFLCTANYSIEL